MELVPLRPNSFAMNKARTRGFQALNVVLYIVMVIVNVVAATGHLYNTTPEEVTYKYPHLFVPVGWAFSIWSVIYLLLGMFVVYQSSAIRRMAPAVLNPELPRSESGATAAQDRAALTRPVRWVNKLDIMFALTCVLNIAWLNAWHQTNYTLAAGIIMGLLLSLVVIYVRIHSMPYEMRVGDKWFVTIPFSVYLGWISVATISGIASMLQSLRWDGMGLTQEFWGGFAAILATTLALFFRFRLGNWAYAGAVAWGLAGVAAQQWNDRDGQGVTASAIIALVCAVLILVSLFLKARMNVIELPPNTQGRAPETA